MTNLSKYVCKTEDEAKKAKGILIGKEYRIIFKPQKVDSGTSNMNRINKGNHPYANKWVVIGMKK